jgi:dihydroorotate dehydrogenase (fumarate)/dihydroorotate dehydrogenase
MSFDLLHRRANYMTLNLSCPNSAQDRDFFDEPAQLELLLSRLATRQPDLPIFLKIKPVTGPGILREVVSI